jgi:hypothetical protein
MRRLLKKERPDRDPKPDPRKDPAPKARRTWSMRTLRM